MGNLSGLGSFLVKQAKVQLHREVSGRIVGLVMELTN